MTVGALECVWTQFTFFYLKMRETDLIVCFATLHKLMVVLSLVRAIALDIFGSLDITGQSHMSLSPAVLALRDTRIHIGSLNYHDKPPYIKAPVNKTLGLTATLNIPNINLND